MNALVKMLMILAVTAISLMIASEGHLSEKGHPIIAVIFEFMDLWIVLLI